MLTGTELRVKRDTAHITGSLVCMKTGIARSRLSDIERGYTRGVDDELQRIDRALDELIEARAVIRKVAVQVGWPCTGELTL